jgi:hypothetical protein
MADQNIGTIRRGVKPFYFKDLGNIKEKKFKSVMVVMDLTLSWSCFSLPKGENPLDVDFERAELMKAIADAPLLFIKEKACRKAQAVLVLSSNGMIVYQCE